MKLITASTVLISAGTVAQGAAIAPIMTPRSAPLEVDLQERGIVGDIVGGIAGEIPKLLSGINFEGIAGWANNLLTEDDNVKYLDDILIGLKDTNLLPEAASFIVAHNYTRSIAGRVLKEGLNILGDTNTTAVWVALDRSGLAYGLLSGLLEDPDLLPFGLGVVKKVIASGAINFGSILQAAEGLISNVLKREEYLAERELLFAQMTAPQTPAYVAKRDNVEDLLTTIFSSVERSQLVEETISKLLSDPQFEDSVAIILEGIFRDINGALSGINFSALKPILGDIIDSGLLEDLFSKAISDPNLLHALINNVGSLISNGTIFARDLVPREVALEYGLLDDEVLYKRANTSSATNHTSSSSVAQSSSTAKVPVSSNAAGSITLKSSGSAIMYAVLTASAFGSVAFV